MSLFSEIVDFALPPWVRLAAVGMALAGVVVWHLHAVHEARGEGYQAAVTERAAADLAATIKRTIENDAVAVQQRAANVSITKAKDEELSPVRARIAADRLRVGPALCDGVALPAQATGTAGGNSADTASRVLPEPMDRDIRALILETEEVGATARACQSFIEKNGLVP